MKKDEHKIKNDNFIEACNNAVNGIIYAATTQRNIKIQLVLAVIIMVLCLFYGLETTEFFCFFDKAMCPTLSISLNPFDIRYLRISISPPIAA